MHACHACLQGHAVSTYMLALSVPFLSKRKLPVLITVRLGWRCVLP